MAKPVLTSVKAIGRKIVELTFDSPVRVRAETDLVSAPSDPYTPVTWPGAAYDAANPANYSLTRQPGDALDGPGEAADLVPTYAEEDHELESIAGGVVYSSVVRVHTDFHQTARCGYTVAVSGLRNSAGETMDPTSIEFVGFVCSQVERNSTLLWDWLPGEVKKTDLDGTLDLWNIVLAMQEVFDRLIEDVDAYVLELCTIGKMREEFLDQLLEDLGNPFELEMTVNQKRKLAAVLIDIYRLKGTCSGIISVVRFFLGVNLTGCRKGWRDGLRIWGGSYGATVPPHGPLPHPTIGIDSRLGPGTSYQVNSFWLTASIMPSASQLSVISQIAKYMMPATAHYMGVVVV